MGVVTKNKKNQYGMVTLASREWVEKPNKIKVIDLYNMIANAEELPKRFKYDNLIWNKAVVGDDWFNEMLMLRFSNIIDTSVLNEEIEILDNENYYIFSSYPDHVELDRDYTYEFKVREKNDTEGITCKKVRMKIVDWEDDYDD